MKLFRTVLFVPVALFLVASLSASVREVQIYGIIERVAFEPNDKPPERIKVWGTFTLLYANQEPIQNWDGNGRGLYTPKRGYLYFKLPPVPSGDRAKSAQEAARREWADLKSVAGTGQAVMFGSWTSAYLGMRSRSDKTGFVSMPPYKESLRVYEEKERSADPITYTMDTGVVKLANEGRFAVIIEQLKRSLPQ
jgi:hypothetical protein